MGDILVPAIFFVFSLLFLAISFDTNGRDSLRSYPVLHDNAQRLFFKVNNHSEVKLSLDSDIASIKSNLENYATTLSLFKSKEAKEQSKDVIIDVNRQSIYSLD
jgi:hypothetical protein